MKNKLKLHISTCPNDTFMFDAFINDKFGDKNRENSFNDKFEIKLLDIEQLNQEVEKNIPDISKVSFFALFNNLKNYVILNSGAALGRNCGPLVIRNNDEQNGNNLIKTIKDLKNKRIAIPGKNTTAFLLFNIFVGKENLDTLDLHEEIFSDIMPKVNSGEYDAGLIIHESRFTYKKLGLKLIDDLGNLWENETGLPLPLGAICAKRNLGKENISFYENKIKSSIQFAFENPKSSNKFIHHYSQEMDNTVLQSHIDLYVNEFSLNLGQEGINAINLLYNYAVDLDFVKKTSNLNLFNNQ